MAIPDDPTELTIRAVLARIKPQCIASLKPQDHLNPCYRIQEVRRWLRPAPKGPVRSELLTFAREIAKRLDDYDPDLLAHNLADLEAEALDLLGFYRGFDPKDSYRSKH